MRLADFLPEEELRDLHALLEPDGLHERVGTIPPRKPFADLDRARKRATQQARQQQRVRDEAARHAAKLRDLRAGADA